MLQFVDEHQSHSLCTATLSPAGGTRTSADPESGVEKHRDQRTVHTVAYSNSSQSALRSDHLVIYTPLDATDLVVDE